MKFNQFICLALLFQVFALQFSCTKKDHSPNILLIVADDTGWNDIGYHNPRIFTPNIDQLCAEGVELDNFYVYPTCSPTRAALLTGMYASRFGIYQPIAMESKQILPSDVATLPGILRDNGYTTAITGKWHLGLRPENGPLQYGFDYSYGFLHGQIDQETHRYKNGDQSWHRMDKFIDEEGHATDLITNEAIKYIKTTRDITKPFFVYVAYSVPHYPVQESDKWVNPYREIIEEESRQVFAASMTHMDDAIGKLITTLEEEGLRDHTLVVFMSDNGGQLSWNPTFEYKMRHGPNSKLGDNYPLRGSKSEVYEGGIRVPALFNWPGVLEPSKTLDMVKVTDLFATIAAVSGIHDLEEFNLDGVNIWPLLTAKESLNNRELFLRTNLSLAYRKGDWKLIHHAPTMDSAKNELFNIALDPTEERDLFADYPEVYLSLWKKLKEQVEMEDQLQQEPVN
jgi:arylsulfatase A-like enzyme